MEIKVFRIIPRCPDSMSSSKRKHRPAPPLSCIIVCRVHSLRTQTYFRRKAGTAGNTSALAGYRVQCTAGKADSCVIPIRLTVKALLHQAIFLATCLTILLRHKLHESLPSVTCSEINMSRTFLLPQSLREVEVGSTSRNGDCTRSHTQGNDSGNLCRDGPPKLRDKLQEKLPIQRSSAFSRTYHYDHCRRPLLTTCRITSKNCLYSGVNEEIERSKVME